LLAGFLNLRFKRLGQKNQAEKKADALARWFLPVVLSLAFITFLASILSQQWGWFRPQDYLKPSFWYRRQERNLPRSFHSGCRVPLRIDTRHPCSSDCGNG